jgi:geranylgeranyl diphosphate synthase type II
MKALMPKAPSPSASVEELSCPTSKATRERLRAMASDLASSWRTGALPTDIKSAAGLRRQAEAIVSRASVATEHVGWTMVTIVSEYWRERLASGPSGRRLLLLPDCPLATGPRVDGVPHVCGPRCTITTLWSAARDSGWVVESTSRAVGSMASLLTGQYDGILGVARLRDLEKAFSRLPAFALPVAAVPFDEAAVCDEGDGRFNSCAAAAAAQAIDPEWILGLLGVAGGAAAPVGDYLPLLREAAEMFAPAALEGLVGRLGIDDSLGPMAVAAAASLQPLHATGRLAGEFLGRGGKFLRPFITLAAFDAVAADREAASDGQKPENLPSRDSVKAAAVAIEVFHKASLVHDDIEDGDQMRYGRPTLHVERGVPCAINVGDYLVGLGYRIIARLPGVEPLIQRDSLSLLADAHVRLAKGQGAELWWRDATDKRLSPAESLEIYGLKTSPAFEAAVAMGIRLAGVEPEKAGAIRRYSLHVGTGFQILNDLKDWSGDLENDRRAAGDLLGGRPTLMWALAMERLTAADAQRLRDVAAQAGAPDASAETIAAAIATARGLFSSADVFHRAAAIVDEQRARAAAAAATCRHSRLREVLEFLLDLAVPEQAALSMVG